MTKFSPINEIHKSHRALFEEENFWSLPSNFGDFLSEYHLVRSHVGILDLCHHTLLQFSGPDRVSYLHGMVSNDVKALRPGKGMAAAVLDLQGKILAETRIYCLEDCILMDIWEPVKDKILKHFNHHLVADDVEIIDLTNKYGLLSLQGRNSRNLITDIGGIYHILSDEYNHHDVVLEGGSCRIMRTTHTGEEGYDIIIENAKLLGTAMYLEEIGKSYSIQWIGTQAQELLRIEAGIPLYGVDISEEYLLLETNLEHAISFEKGCYLGQEVVERIHSRGHVNKKFVGILMDGNITAHRGSAILSMKGLIGRVTSSIVSPILNRPLALGYVQMEFTGAGTIINIQHINDTIKGEVSRLPFYNPSIRDEC